MNRREALSRIALLVGGTLSTPTLHAMERLSSPERTVIGKPAFVLTDAQRQIVAEVAELIIPKTSTPGAKDAGVPAFIEMMLNDCYKQPEQLSFLEGVMDLEKKSFMTLTQEQRVATLTQVEADTKEMIKALNVKQVKVGDNVDKETMDVKKGVPFWRLMKELTLLGYFTSKEGITTNFEYEPIPTKFEAIKIKPGQKAYVHG